MPRTRATKASTQQSDKPSTEPPKAALPPSDSNPSKVFILPSNATEDARIVSLPNPADGQLNRYFVCPKRGIYEFLRVSDPRISSPRSWLFTNAAHPGRASLVQSQDLFVATPVDAVFFLIALFLSSSAEKQRQQQPPQFLAFEDLVDKWFQSLNSQLKYLLLNPTFAGVFTRRLFAVCDVVEAGDDSMYRLSLPKIAELLLAKAQRATNSRLPESLEARFVTQQLREPSVMASTTIVSAVDSPLQNDATDENESGTVSTTDSTQSLAVSLTTTTISSIGSTVNLNIPLTLNAKSDMPQLLRLKTTLDFILGSYIPPHSHASITAQFKFPPTPPSSTISLTYKLHFAPLVAHLAHLDQLRADAIVLRSSSTLADNISRKRRGEGGNDDDGGGEAEFLRAEKKRKKEEEEQRSKLESRAIKQLKKADTSGMKKLSSFFTMAKS